MKNETLISILTLTIAILLAILLFNKCSNEPITTTTVTKLDTITVIDTVYIEKEVYRPEYTTIIREIPKYITEIDTIFITQDYFSKKYYIDTVKDSLINLYIEDTIFMNSIHTRKVAYKLLLPKETITITKEIKEEERLQFGAGATFTSNKNAFINAGLKFKDDNSLVVGYDVMNKDFQLTFIKYFNGRKK